MLEREDKDDCGQNIYNHSLQVFTFTESTKKHHYLLD